MKTLIKMMMLIISLGLIVPAVFANVEIGEDAYVSATFLKSRDNSLNPLKTKLPLNTKVTIVGKREGYSLVELSNGKKVYLDDKYLKKSPIKHSFAVTEGQLENQDYTFEILTDDPIKKTRTKFWDHVAVRLRGPNVDKIYDFGRYGKMWGQFNTEGDQVLRIWDNQSYRYLHKKVVGYRTVLKRFVFKLTEAEFNQALSLMEDGVQGPYKGSRNIRSPWATNNLWGDESYHFIDNSCPHLAVKVMEEVLDIDVNSRRNLKKYVKVKGIFGSYKFALKMAFGGRYKKQFWWPKDFENYLSGEKRKFKRLIEIETWNPTDFNNKKGRVTYSK